MICMYEQIVLIIFLLNDLYVVVTSNERIQLKMTQVRLKMTRYDYDPFLKKGQQIRLKTAPKL